MIYSKNKKAEEIVGFRQTGFTICVDLPHELGYICPICKIKGESLDWSEYNGFLYCYNCNIDIPSHMCCVDIKKGIDIFLDTINTAKGN